MFVCCNLIRLSLLLYHSHYQLVCCLHVDFHPNTLYLDTFRPPTLLRHPELTQDEQKLESSPPATVHSPLPQTYSVLLTQGIYSKTHIQS